MNIMNMSYSVKNNPFQMYNKNVSGKADYMDDIYSRSGSDRGKGVREIKRKISESKKSKEINYVQIVVNKEEKKVKEYKNSTNQNIFTTMQEYSNLLKNNRSSSKNTTNIIKKLKYHFKDMSSKIIRSKTSSSAKQVAGQAKREVMRLKREKQSNKYDAEEIDAAIIHAKAMERVAKKKVKHLEEEERAKAANSIFGGMSLEEKEEIETDDRSVRDKILDDEQSEDDSAEETSYDLLDDFDEAQMFECEEEISEEISEEMLSELYDSMEEMLEELGLDELSDELFNASGDMEYDDYKKLQLKHRNDEMKDIVKADSEYLKSLFEFYEKQKESGAAALAFGGGNNAGGSLGITGGEVAISTDISPIDILC